MKHNWRDTELWGRKAIKCAKCQLHIVDYPMPSAVKVGGNLIIQLPELPPGIKPGKLPRGVKEGALPEGKPVRWQTSNVLNVDFTNKTRRAIIAYAEDSPNRACEGVRKPAESAKWK